MVVYAPRWASNILYDLGYAMVENDKKDIGKFGGGHTFMHHYVCGTILMLLGGLGQHVDEGKQKYWLQALNGRNPYVRHSNGKN